MTELASNFDGRNGYHTSLLHAVTPLTSEQLLGARALIGARAVELARHISDYPLTSCAPPFCSHCLHG